MPVYNAEAYLAEAIVSVLAQTAPRFEFIIIDDGSTDASAEIAEAFAARDRRIRLFRGGANRGVASRLNEGLAHASADLIARMDADDISLPGRFAAQLAFLKDHPDAVLVGSRALIIDPEGDELCERGSALTHEEIDSGLMNAAGQLVYHSSVLYRKSAAFASGGYDERFRSAEDLDFFLKMAERGRIANIAKPLICYREHFSKIGYRLREEQAREIEIILAATHARRNVARDHVAVAKAERLVFESRAATHRKWGWWALQSGRLAAARKHAFRALALAPGPNSARLVYCALRGR